MTMQRYNLVILNLLLSLSPWYSFAQNPLIRDQFTADPSARVFGDSVFVYASHDIAGIEGMGYKGWFCMEDYHVFSSSNLTDWTDHGVIVSQDNVTWVNSASYSMWAPDCIYRNGKYYFYFPALAKDTVHGKGFSVGVAISDKPYGPFIPKPEPILNVHGIDPNPFTDSDGQSYLYWAIKGKILGARLKDNMLELASEPQVIDSLPESGLKEGPYLFKREGIYYMTYPHVQNKTERLEYAISDNPVGPFTFAGVIMDELPTGCWTNHQSIIEFKDQWYLFYHNNDLSPKFDKNRSIRCDSLFFNIDGTIQKVIPTFRGVGVTDALQKIEIDRYSLRSDTGTSIVFMDSLNTFNGWKTVLDKKNAWIQYNAVDFGKDKYTSVKIKASSLKGGKLHIYLDKPEGPLLAEIKISENTGWIIADSRVLKFQPGIHNLIVVSMDTNPVEIDWIRFY